MPSIISAKLPWPLSGLGKPRMPSRGTIEAIYGMIVAQAREPLFYQAWGLPDTVNGRFDMVVLHLWLVLRHARTLDGAEGLSQALFDHFCNDMDGNLREMGVGDLTVPKRMKAFGEAFYGRGRAYDEALERGENDLAQALSRNVLNSANPHDGRRLAAYVMLAIDAMAGLDLTALSGGGWRFPAPTSHDA